MEKTLGFSEPFLAVEHISYEENYEIADKSIVINMDLDPLETEGMNLPYLKSILCANTVIEKVKNLIVISIANLDYLGNNPEVDREIIKNGWQHIFTLTNDERLRNTELWRSEKKRIGGTELNLWYATAGTNCGMYHIDELAEIHTQIYGIGRMQTYRTKNFNSLSREIYVSPGHTYDPFYPSQEKSTWHQYYADTDCIWLGIVRRPL
ncbi:MAG: hypothetical protein MI975_02580 [Cytophagales bacterium]|nr:hypothetical protein [Cytophagales bacterium]